ncbi:zinc finger and BTB domain-containing protein 25 isoform X2 [Echinops telfairi]|uniref:Zinc finger and BTB domain-containing protein 25 isoform X2 n=1 Tax=Echinops telfairi TaxID=9371 RepID=A0AC55CVV9_ECHTE|nr:zinc finger and BTB domain-containing protein 25 isoform X2 [Echinops telfairi]
MNSAKTNKWSGRPPRGTRGLVDALLHRLPLPGGECIKIQPADIQPDIFSYLLHIMYTGKGPKQIVDHSRLEEGIRFLHADYLSHIATEMNQVFSPEPVQPSNLYGIQISTTQKAAVKQGLEAKEAPSSNSGDRAAAQSDHPHLQLSLAIGLDDGTADQQRAHPAAQALQEHPKPPGSIKQERCDPESVISQSHPSPSSAATGPTFTENSLKIHLCHYCGERFDSRNSLRQHLHTHVSGSLPFGVPASILESNDLGEVPPLGEGTQAPACSRLSSFVKETEQQPERPERAAGAEPLQISQVSLISKDTEPVELNCNFSFSRKRKVSCTICGHKFLRKSQLLEHMYTHKGKSYRYSRCQRFGTTLAQRFQPYCDSWPGVPLKSPRLSQEHSDSACALDPGLTEENVDTILVE